MLIHFMFYKQKHRSSLSRQSTQFRCIRHDKVLYENFMLRRGQRAATAAVEQHSRARERKEAKNIFTIFTVMKSYRATKELLAIDRWLFNESKNAEAFPFHSSRACSALSDALFRRRERRGTKGITFAGTNRDRFSPLFMSMMIFVCFSFKCIPELV